MSSVQITHNDRMTTLVATGRAWQVWVESGGRIGMYELGVPVITVSVLRAMRMSQSGMFARG